MNLKVRDVVVVNKSKANSCTVGNKALIGRIKNIYPDKSMDVLLNEPMGKTVICKERDIVKVIEHYEEIQFKQIPEEENRNVLYMGINFDRVYSILANDVPIGIVYVSDMNSQNTIYIEWLELLSVFRSKGFLRRIMTELSNQFGKLVFTSDESLEKKYDAIGAKRIYRDEVNEHQAYEYIAS